MVAVTYNIQLQFNQTKLTSQSPLMTTTPPPPPPPPHLDFSSPIVTDSTTTSSFHFYCAPPQPQPPPHLLTTSRRLLLLQPPPDPALLTAPSPSPSPAPPQSTSRSPVDQSSFCWDAAAKQSCFDSLAATSVLSDAAASPSKSSSMELMKEITRIEVEILQLERYLLSLYRKAFQHQGTCIEDKMRSHVQATDSHPCHELDWTLSESDSNHHYQTLPSNAFTCSSYHIKAAPKSSSRKENSQADPVHRSLADHLGTILMDDALDFPNKLSEEIVRCICCIYCKFSDPALPQKGLSVSSTSSLSSSSTFSPRNISGGWSPQFHEEPKWSVEGLKDVTSPYAATVEVVKMSVDDQTYQYVARVLEKFRSLVKRLESVDPRKMKREEKLSFWINIHNALVMHSYLAYGTHNFVRSSSILKAAYNVGGCCVNAHTIQSSILGIRSHYSAPWLQTLLSPKKKLASGSGRHTYSLEYAEPLVHFALCSGSCSDPPVRVYTSGNVFQELRVARDEFIRANVYIQKETKLYLPKLVCYFAREMALSTSEVVEMVGACLPEPQQRAMRRTCTINGTRAAAADRKYIYWIPQGSAFRYLIHNEVFVQGQGGGCAFMNS